MVNLLETGIISRVKVDGSVSTSPTLSLYEDEGDEEDDDSYVEDEESDEEGEDDDEDDLAGKLSHWDIIL